MIKLIFLFLARSVHNFTFARVVSLWAPKRRLTGISPMLYALLLVIAWLLIGCAIAWIIGGASGNDNAPDQ